MNVSNDSPLPSVEGENVATVGVLAPSDGLITAVSRDANIGRPRGLDGKSIDVEHQVRSRSEESASFKKFQNELSASVDANVKPHGDFGTPDFTIHQSLAPSECEENIFPSSNCDKIIGKASGDLQDTLTDVTGRNSQLNGAAAFSLPSHKDNKLHPFGLSRSGLEDAYPKHDWSSNTSSGINGQGHLMNPNVGRDASFPGYVQHQFGMMTDSTLVREAQGDNYRMNEPSDPYLLHDAMDGCQLFCPTQESNHFKFAGQLMSQKLLKKQIMEQNLFPPWPALRQNNNVLENYNVPPQYLPNSGLSQGKLIQQQQMIDRSMPDLESLLQHQLECQKLFQLQLRQLQQQQFLLQIRRRQQQQQLRLKAHQVIIDQLIQQQAQDLRAKKVFEPILSRQNLLKQLLQPPYPPVSHYDPSLGPLVQAHGLQREHDDGFLEHLPHAKHGHLLPLEMGASASDHVEVPNIASTTPMFSGTGEPQGWVGISASTISETSNSY